MAEKKIAAAELTAELSQINSWERRGEKIFKRFNFENFAESLAFVNKIGAIAEKADHHPDITFGWGYAEICLTTHDAGGLTRKDFDLAKQIEDI